MLAEAGIPGTDDWWLMRLANELGNGLPRMGRLTRYRDGDALLPDNAWDVGTRESYMRWLKRSRLHIVETIRDARTDRQRVIGFRTGADGDESGDLAAWKHWTRNRMKVQSRQFFNDTADYGKSYLLTMPAADGPLWNVRNGWTTITEPNALRPWLTEAGITVGFDPIAQAEVIVLHRPGYFRVAFRPTRVPTLMQDGTPWYPGKGWSWAGGPVRNVSNDSLLQRNQTVDGFGVYEKHLDSVDRINEITLNTITLIVMQAFRQRGVKGNLPEFYPEGHPQAGEKVDYDELFKAGPAALWLLPVGSEVWESNFTDITPIFTYRRDELKVLMSNTRTPQDIFDGESANQSAAGSQNSKEPLIHAVQAMNDQAEVSLAQAMAQSFEMVGDAIRADVTEIEVLFGKISPATLAEKAEAVAKMGGKPSQRYINSEVLEMTPAQQRQDEQDRTTEMFQTALAAASASGVTGSGDTNAA
ncbi:hypothetical protein [Microbacterium trichothecenolyticum]|uniref:SPP1 Gp6-like portal protein n=1 Tax=Microbacterium trichothecenolyticum TaxID=69370 RepID=A0A0M2H763_MICTR|nr:hypothetical protein [Microbacterium trichothecenolyticum]KJL39918.1 hypothetical protein RS82_04131 [Microbacterium trichothecenolyticum]